MRAMSACRPHAQVSIDLPSCSQSSVAPDMPSTMGLLSSHNGSRATGMGGPASGKTGHAGEGLCNGPGRTWPQRLLLATNALLATLVLALVLALFALVARNDSSNAAALSSSAGRPLPRARAHSTRGPLLSSPVLSIPMVRSMQSLSALLPDEATFQTLEDYQSSIDGNIVVVFCCRFAFCVHVVVCSALLRTGSYRAEITVRAGTGLCMTSVCVEEGA